MPAATLPGAIAERFAAASSLDWVDGGITYGEAADLKPPPSAYVIFADQGGKFQYDTSPSYVRGTTFRFWCHSATGHHDCTRMVDALADLFHPDMDPLEFDGGDDVVAYAIGGGMDVTEYADASGRKIRVHYVDFTFLTDRPSPS
jgi:hypothetical protein